MQISKVFRSVEFALGLIFLLVGLCALAFHATDPRLLVLAPFGGGLLLSEAVSRVVKSLLARSDAARRGVR